MKKYAALRKFLKEKAEEFRNSGQIDHPMTFKEVEALGVALPPSAYKHRAWWSNNKYNNNSNRPWERAGFRTKDVDMIKKQLVFRRVPPPPPSPPKTPAERQASRDRLLKRIRGNSASAGMADGARAYSGPEKIAPGTPPRCRHPAYGALKGYIRLVAGTDLTEPADPEWGERAWGDDTK